MQKAKTKKAYGSSKVLDKHKEDILRELRKVVRKEITIEDLALKYNVSRATFFNWMKKRGISITKVAEEMKKEMEEKAERKVKKRDLMLAPPKDYKEFLEMEIVKEVKEKMLTANKNLEYIRDTLSFWYNISLGRLKAVNVTVYEPVHPIIPFKEPRYLTKYIAVAREHGYNVEGMKYKIRAIAKWLNIILPPEFETHEYKGKYQNAELDVKLRYLFLRTAKELFPNEYETIRAIAIYLFQGGGRKEALWNTEYVGVRKVRNKDIVEMYKGIDVFDVYESREKAKGEKSRHKILIPKPFAKYVNGYIPMKKNEVNCHYARIMKEIFRVMLQRYRKLMNKDTIGLLGEAIKEMEKEEKEKKEEKKKKRKNRKKMKIYHIWRHTFAREGLRASKWNMYLIAKLGKWDKVDTLKIYGDFSIDELLDKETESYLLFLYNSWLEKAIEEKLL